jgi:hypothetical protein
MATIEQVRKAMRNAPFTIRLVDGRSFHVEHRDFISVPNHPRGRNITLNEGRNTHEIDILLIQSLDFVEPELDAESAIDSNGAQPPETS